MWKFMVDCSCQHPHQQSTREKAFHPVPEVWEARGHVVFGVHPLRATWSTCRVLARPAHGTVRRLCSLFLEQKRRPRHMGPVIPSFDGIHWFVSPSHRKFACQGSALLSQGFALGSLCGSSMASWEPLWLVSIGKSRERAEPLRNLGRFGGGKTHTILLPSSTTGLWNYILTREFIMDSIVDSIYFTSWPRFSITNRVCAESWQGTWAQLRDQ